MDSICHLDIITIYGAVRVMPVNKSSNSKLCGWLTWCLFVRFSQSVVCQRIGMSLSLHRLSLTVMFEWTHFSSDWHHTVNQCLQKLSSTHTHFATKHMLDFVVFLVTWPYFFHQIASIVHFKGAHIFSPIARHEREREKQQENQSRLRATAKFHIGKCVFNFLHLLL